MSSINALTSGSQGVGPSGLSGMSTDDFTKLVLTELTKQDPLSPNDTNQMIQQFATIRSIQSNMDLSASLSQMTEENSFASAANMMGRTVSGMSIDYEEVTGRVTSVSKTSAGVMLTLEGGEQVPMAWVTDVTTPVAHREAA